MEKKVLKTTRIEAEQTLNQFIGKLKLEGLSVDAKVELVKLKLQLTKVVAENNEFRNTTIASVEKPNNYSELQKEANAADATEEDKNTFAEVQKQYNEKLIEVLAPYFNEEVELAFGYISEKDFYELVAHNDVNSVYGYEYVYDKLVDKNK